MASKEPSNFENFLKEVFEDLKEKQISKSFSAHYGLPLDFQKKHVRKFLITLIESETTSEALDTCFPNLKGEDKVKVIAFCEALQMIDKLK